LKKRGPIEAPAPGDFPPIYNPLSTLEEAWPH